MRIYGAMNTGLADGTPCLEGDFSSSVDSNVLLKGQIAGICIKYNNCPSTATVTISTAGTNMPAMDILTIDGANTDGWFFPAQQGCDVDGAPIVGAYVSIIVFDYITVALDNVNDNSSVDVWLTLTDD